MTQIEYVETHWLTSHIVGKGLGYTDERLLLDAI